MRYDGGVSRRALAWCFVLPLLGVGCESKPEQPVADPQAFVEAAIREDASICPMGRAEFCLDELVGPAIETELNSVQHAKLGGKLPTTDRKLARFADEAKRRYKQMHTAEEAERAAVVAKMRAVYENPSIVREGPAVYVDLGVLPVGFRKARAGWNYGGSDPALVDGFAWRASEMVAKFDAARAAHPDATVYVLRLVMPRGSSSTELVLAWRPDLQKISVVDGGRPWAIVEGVGPNLDGFRGAGARPFDEMLSCDPGESGTPFAACPPIVHWPDDP